MSEPTLVMLCGVPASGKSTYAKIEKERAKGPCVVLSTDAFIEKKAQELGTTYDRAFSDWVGISGAILNRDLSNAIKDDVSIIWDQTNLTVRSRQRKLKRIPPHYYRVAVWFDITLDGAMYRNSLRPGKTIPSSTLQSMYEQFVIPSKAEGFDEVIRIQS